MRFKNFIFILALFMVLLCCFSAVSASENVDDSVSVSDDVAMDEVVSEVDSDDESISVQENEEIESSDDVDNESLEVSDIEEVDDVDDSSSVLSAEENDNEVSGQTPQDEILSDIEREVKDNESFEEAFSKMSKQGYSDPAQVVNILISSGIYTITIKPDLEWEYDDEYEFGYYSSSGVSKLFALGIFTVEGIGDNVIFRCTDGYNLDLKGGLDTTEWGTEAIRDKITHKNIIFDCDVTLGSRSYEFINCTFNKTLSINGYDVNQYWNLYYETDCDVINNITFTDCNFVFDKEDISINKIADENIQFKEDAFTLSFENCKFNFTETTPVIPAVETTLSINSTEKGIVIITVKDAEGNPVANVEVKYNNGGENITKTTNNEGIVSVSDLTGEGEIKAYFEGNESYLKSEGSYKYNFTETTPVIPAVETTLSFNSTEKGIVIITVKDAEGNPVANVEVKYNNGGENITKTTNNEGIVSVSDLTGEGEIKAYFEGNESYLKSEGSFKYNFTETTPAGNGTSGNGTSTNTGKTTTNTPKVTKKATKITAKKATFKAKKKTKKYTIVLKAGKKAVKKVKVTLKVGKKTYKATTNSKGKATFKITKLNKKGKYTAVIKFKGNKNFKPTSKKVKITVKK